MSALPIHLALGLALIESLGLGLLLLRVRGVAGMRLLVLFLFGVAVWVLSCELPSWFGPQLIPYSTALVAVSSLTSAVFLHFVIVLCGLRLPRAAIYSSYGMAAAATILGLIFPSGDYRPLHGMQYFFVPNDIGWIVGWVWALLAAAGHLVMFWHWWQRRGPPRGQLVAMCLASGWGLLCMTAFTFVPLGITSYPFPLLLLPVYPVILVYGILRYELMIVNAWARRGLAWALMVGAGALLVVAVAALPIPFGETGSSLELWLMLVFLFTGAGLLLDPFRRLATRLIYPGSHLAGDDVERWRSALARAESFVELEQLAAREISAQLRVAIDVSIGAATPVNNKPTLICAREGEHWQTRMQGWEAAPPGPLYVAQLFGAALADAAQRLELALQLAQREGERHKQERLAELGALAATVAHDIRNPLNIINMAAAMAPAEVRSEISAQTARISQLATDLLDYAKSWQIEKQSLELADYVQSIAAPYGVSIGAGLQPGSRVAADPRRLQQALINLLDNARMAAAGKGILVDAETLDDGAVELSICDNGSGVPPEIRETLFQPFVSRRPEGTGLGLAIVAKIMQAHGGSARLGSKSGWNTCFVLSFPRSSAS